MGCTCIKTKNNEKLIINKNCKNKYTITNLIDLHKERLFKPQVRVREVVGTKELSKIYNNERKYRDGNIGK